MNQEDYYPIGCSECKKPLGLISIDDPWVGATMVCDQCWKKLPTSKESPKATVDPEHFYVQEMMASIDVPSLCITSHDTGKSR